MKKHDARFLVRHVLMDGDDFNFAPKQRLEDRLQFVLRYGEVSIDYRIVIATGESRPGVYAHFLIDRSAVHFCRAANRKLNHAVFGFALKAKYLVKSCGCQRSRCGQRTLPKCPE